MIDSTHSQRSRSYLRCTLWYPNHIPNIHICRTLPGAHLLFINHDPFSTSETVDTVAYCSDLSQAFISTYVDISLI